MPSTPEKSESLKICLKSPPVTSPKENKNARGVIKSFDPRMPKRRAFPSSPEIIAVIVGKNENANCFKVHEDLLTSNSRYFHAALRGDFSEAVSKTVTLEEDCHITFWYCYQWLYQQKIIELENENEEAFQHEWSLLVKAFFIGDKLQDDAFCDAIIDSMIAKSNAPFEGYHHFLFFQNVTSLVYNNTAPQSPLRKLLIDQHVHHGSETWYANAALETVDKAFLLDLNVPLMCTRPKPPGEAPYHSGNTCMYHKHGENDPCYQTKS